MPRAISKGGSYTDLSNPKRTNETRERGQIIEVVTVGNGVSTAVNSQRLVGISRNKKNGERRLRKVAPSSRKRAFSRDSREWTEMDGDGGQVIIRD